MIELDVDELLPPRWMLRPLKEEVIIELMRSIRTTGLLQPIVVRQRHDGYEVVFGNHRLKACRRIGMKRVSVSLRDFSEEEAFLARLSENLLRNSFVDPIQEAEGYAMLVRKGWTINAIGEMVGKCDSYICERMGLLERLCEDLRKKVSRGLITASHAELISRISDPIRQDEVAQLVRKKKLSVRSLETYLRDVPSPTKIWAESKEGEYYLRIPKEFANAIGIEIGQQLFIFIRGKRKLVIENACSSSKGIRTCETGSWSHRRSRSSHLPTFNEFASTEVFSKIV